MPKGIKGAVVRIDRKATTVRIDWAVYEVLVMEAARLSVAAGQPVSLCDTLTVVVWEWLSARDG